MIRPLRVFLCHSSNDKPAVRELYQKLRAEAWIQPWLDEEELYPGQDWNMEIEKAVEAADAIIVCLTKGSINKEGYVQRELRIVLDFADYKPEGTLYIMPVRLEECEPPRRLRAWQYADYFEGQRERGFERLLVSLKRRSDSLGLEIESFPQKETKNKTIPVPNWPISAKENKPVAVPPNKITLSNSMEFMRVPVGKFVMGSDNHDGDEKPRHIVDIPYDYWMARFLITNELYNSYIESISGTHPVDGWEKKKNHPVVNIKWEDVMAYCQWSNNLLETELPLGLILRLPTEAEWEKAARGTDGFEYPWGNEFDKNKCNTKEGGKDSATAVGYYSPQGDSPYGCADMSGNVWEWTSSLYMPYPFDIKNNVQEVSKNDKLVLRGGSFVDVLNNTRCATRYFNGGYAKFIGIRLCIGYISK